MKKFFRFIVLCALMTVTLTVCAFAAADTLKVGLYYGDNALFSANLQNYRGSGYDLGWFDEVTRDFVSVGYLTEEKISMTADGNVYISGGSYYAEVPAGYESTIGGYHVQLNTVFNSYDEAKYVANQFQGGFVAYINNAYLVRVNHFLSSQEAEIAAATYGTYTWTDVWGTANYFSGSVVTPSASGVTVTVTATNQILFEFDCSGAKSLGILPRSNGEQTVTWFKGYKWYGGFEYRRSTGGNINVINVVGCDDYIRGVLPYEMSPDWPLEALKAQAVCARTYAMRQTRHDKYGFDVCNTTDCQVYYGTNKASTLTDQAAIETAGIVATYGGSFAETYYYSSNGGATESVENVWTESRPYLVGKPDPYEAMITIPGYSYTVTYTYSQLTQLLQSKGYTIGTVCDAYVSANTLTGNVREITFVDTTGRTLKITGEKCRTVLSTSMFGDSKSVKSLRFNILGGSGGKLYYVNGSGETVSGITGVYTISGTGTVSQYTGKADETYVLTSSGMNLLQEKVSTPTSTDGITVTGAGSGHNVGMSQYGAKAMAQMGMSFMDILNFYFTGVTLERIGYGF